MKSEMPWWVRVGFFFALAGSAVQGAEVVHGLKAMARGGQVFLTWREDETAVGTSFNVYVAGKAIGDVSEAKLVGHHLERHSARDWWEDPASFKKGVAAGTPVGFRIQEEGPLLNPQDGLFVHTVGKGETGTLFFAVTRTDAEGKEDTALVAGANSLKEGIAAPAGAMLPIWVGKGEAPEAGAGKGKALWLNLHAKGGVVAGMEYLVFGDASMGWREGLAFKYSVRMQGDEVIVQPTDRVWINRPHKEANDGGTPAIWTFWYGYNSHIYDRKLMATGVPVNYTERRNLWILDWVSKQYQPDPNQWYCSGGSMGGCGTMSFGLRHPELFAACHARVPIVSYTYLGRASATRLEPSCWTGAIPPDLKTEEGVPLLERMNATKFVTESKADLPYVFLLNGRQDGSIPWPNNPPFYKAMEAEHQGFAAYWDNGAHSTSGKDAPDDVNAWMQRFRRFRLDQSYPAFSGTSTDRRYGDGRAEDGDIIGWLNRGMDWKDVEDAADHYAITLLADYPGVEYPVKTTVTLRRVQKFQVKAGEKLQVSLGDAAPHAITADAAGRISIDGLSIAGKDGLRVVVRRL
ncbi:MAG: prolyl oligopeptidase family serine peptidase [Prosthecobacter sp.]|nr:prolyl oligopeptidase family serine peptidase [Prosthecobacter sp.]